MSFGSGASVGRICGVVLVLLAVTAFLTPQATAQETTTPKVELFGGYSWFDPNPDLGIAEGNPFLELQSAEKGFAIASTYNFTPYVGWSVSSSVHFEDQYRWGTVTTGPKFTWRNEGISPFATAQVGWARLGISGFGEENAVSLIAGGGLDMHVHPAISLRLIEADFVYAPHNFGPDNLEIKGARLSTGVIFNFGSLEPPIPPSARCTATPTEIMAGEPVQVTATTANFKPGKTLTYTWNTNGGQVEGQGETVNINTQGLAPGSYSVTAHVQESAKRFADCSASFTVKEPPKNPPSISCSADPTTVQQGETSTIRCTVQNPDQRPLTYQWSATAGTVQGQENVGTLKTTGAPAGPITVTTTVRDDRGLSDSANSRVTVEVPPPPPEASKLNEIQFKRNSARVDNAAKAILDDVALRLQRDADATAVIVGYAQSGERRAEQLAAQRAVNAKAYLTKEKGIDPNRIEVRSAADGKMAAEIWIVPAGATFEGTGTMTVDETKVKPTRR